MPRAFISYRRADTGGVAQRLADELRRRLPRFEVFLDLHTKPGEDFVDVLEHELSTCDVLIALIGPQWLSITTDDGQRRLDLEGDFVRLEIARALERILVIPVLVEEAAIPAATSLPEPLKELPRRQGLRLRQETWHADIHVLTTELRVITKSLGRWISELNARTAQMAMASMGIGLLLFSAVANVDRLTFDNREIGYALALNWSANLIAVFPWIVKCMLDSLHSMTSVLESFDKRLLGTTASIGGMWRARVTWVVPRAVAVVSAVTLTMSLWQGYSTCGRSLQHRTLDFVSHGEYISWCVGALLHPTRIDVSMNIAFTIATAVAQAVVFTTLLVFVVTVGYAFIGLTSELERRKWFQLAPIGGMKPFLGTDADKTVHDVVKTAMLVNLCMLLARLQASYLTSEAGSPSILSFMWAELSDPATALTKGPDAGLLTFSGIMTTTMLGVYLATTIAVAGSLDRLARSAGAAPAAAWPSTRLTRRVLFVLGCVIFSGHLIGSMTIALLATLSMLAWFVLFEGAPVPECEKRNGV
jgi:TIR domain